MNKRVGQGKTSRIPTELHTLQYSGLYWQHQEDIDELRRKKILLNEARRHGYNSETLDQYLADKASGKIVVIPKGQGVCSTKRTELHNIRADGKWWRSREDLANYRDHQSLVKRAKQAGYDYTQVDDYLKMSEVTHNSIERSRRRERTMKNQITRLKAKYGLHKNANRIHLKTAVQRARDPEDMKFLELIDTYASSDAEKLAKIRALYLSGAAPYDLLYQIALLVGINLRKIS